MMCCIIPIATGEGSREGVNVVNIALGDYDDGITGHETADEIINDGITVIHDKVDESSEVTCVPCVQLDII